MPDTEVHQPSHEAECGNSPRDLHRKEASRYGTPAARRRHLAASHPEDDSAAFGVTPLALTPARERPVVDLDRAPVVS
ncbi:hypothetical protein FHS29_006302 [Saccharothrix tamanrassetensis]|uniref:Uncharacterized protein n=1 Tax=Saccharothrix tamanrassetensis TaxID=1051531 RepID=A0A841CPR9_9PSEU|nr:hypothetical protein [Saccharothrix tamanrassetensis]